MKTQLLAIILILSAFAHAQEGQEALEAAKEYKTLPIIDMSDVSVRSVCQKLLGHVKIVAASRGSQTDSIVRSYGGWQFLWGKGDGVAYDGSGAAFGARFTKEQQDFRKEVLPKLRAGLNQLSIQAGLTLDPAVQGQERASQIELMSAAYMLVTLDPKLYGLSFPERVKARIAAATLLNEMSMQVEGFVFDPLKAPVGRRIYLAGENTGYDTYLEMMKIAGNRPFGTWGYWHVTGKVAAKDSKGPSLLLYGENSSREILWLQDKKEYQKGGDLNLWQIRVTRHSIGYNSRALLVTLRQPDGSWMPLVFDIDKNKQLIPVKTIKGEPLEQFCVRCHTEMKAGKMLPSGIKTSEDLINELRPLRSTPVHIQQRDLDYILNH